MLKDITIGQYIPGESFVHKLDPRTKIIIAMLFIVTLFIMNKFIGYIFVVAFLAAIITPSSIRFRFATTAVLPLTFLLIPVLPYIQCTRHFLLYLQLTCGIRYH